MPSIDIANNIKAVELIKVELLKNLADLFGDISAEADSETGNRIADDAANIINLTYLLCKRLGVDYEEVKSHMKIKLKNSIKENHPLEKRFKDLSALLEKIN